MAFELTYLFECHFSDGTFLQQTKEDVSKTDPTKSAFFDVVNSKQEVTVFGLYNDTNTLIVDLRDGHFEVNGVPFNFHAEHYPEQPTEFRLIYFHRHRHTVTMGQPTTELDHTVEYHCGWQTTVNGKNYQQTIAVS